MSFFRETKQQEVLEFAEDEYAVGCPYCNAESIEYLGVTTMPWNIDEEIVIECPKCHKTFEIRPEDKFSKKILKKFSNSSKRELSLFKDSLKASLKTNKSCLLVDTDGDTLLMGNQINIALSILNWLEE